ncbi:potassium ABC transporter ATPase [Undibacterium sp.]
MDYLMDILYVGGIVLFFLLIWALAKGCDALGGRA